MLVYCSIVRSIVEYASPVWAAIPLYLDELIESVQRKALKIIFGRVAYTEALVLAGLESPVSYTHLTLPTKRIV